MSVLMKNRLTKTLTPIRCDDEYLKLCRDNDTIKRMDFISQRIKHVIRYYKKAEIYNFNDKMPFLDNVIRCVPIPTLVPELLTRTPICEIVCMMIAEYYWEYECVICNGLSIPKYKTVFMVILPQVSSSQTDERRYIHAQCIIEKISSHTRGKTKESLYGISRNQEEIEELDKLEEICDSFFDTNYTITH